MLGLAEPLTLCVFYTLLKKKRQRHVQILKTLQQTTFRYFKLTSLSTLQASGLALNNGFVTAQTAANKSEFL